MDATAAVDVPARVGEIEKNGQACPCRIRFPCSGVSGEEQDAVRRDDERKVARGTLCHSRIALGEAVLVPMDPATTWRAGLPTGRQTTRFTAVGNRRVKNVSPLGDATHGIAPCS